MPSHPLRVGFPSLPDGPRTSVEGGRVTFDGAGLRLLLACDQPTVPEVEAVERGPVDLAIYHRDGLAALVAVIGERAGPGYLETCAPLVLESYRRGCHETRDEADVDAMRVQLVLCQARDMVARAIRDLTVAPPLRRALHHAAHAQARRFGSAAEAARAHEVGLRALTVEHLLRHAAVRDRVAD